MQVIDQKKFVDLACRAYIKPGTETVCNKKSSVKSDNYGNLGYEFIVYILEGNSPADSIENKLS